MVQMVISSNFNVYTADKGGFEIQNISFPCNHRALQMAPQPQAGPLHHLGVDGAKIIHSGSISMRSIINYAPAGPQG